MNLQIIWIHVMLLSLPLSYVNTSFLSSLTSTVCWEMGRIRKVDPTSRFYKFNKVRDTASWNVKSVISMGFDIRVLLWFSEMFCFWFLLFFFFSKQFFLQREKFHTACFKLYRNKYDSIKPKNQIVEADDLSLNQRNNC